MVLHIIRTVQASLKYRGGWKGLFEHMYTVSARLAKAMALGHWSNFFLTGGLFLCAGNVTAVHFVEPVVMILAVGQVNFDESIML